MSHVPGYIGLPVSGQTAIPMWDPRGPPQNEPMDLSIRGGWHSQPAPRPAHIHPTPTGFIQEWHPQGQGYPPQSQVSMQWGQGGLQPCQVPGRYLHAGQPMAGQPSQVPGRYLHAGQPVAGQPSQVPGRYLHAGQPVAGYGPAILPAQGWESWLKESPQDCQPTGLSEQKRAPGHENHGSSKRNEPPTDYIPTSSSFLRALMSEPVPPPSRQDGRHPNGVPPILGNTPESQWPTVGQGINSVNTGPFPVNGPPARFFHPPAGRGARSTHKSGTSGPRGPAPTPTDNQLPINGLGIHHPAKQRRMNDSPAVLGPPTAIQSTTRYPPPVNMPYVRPDTSSGSSQLAINHSVMPTQLPTGGSSVAGTKPTTGVADVNSSANTLVPHNRGKQMTLPLKKTSIRGYQPAKTSNKKSNDCGPSTVSNGSSTGAGGANEEEDNDDVWPPPLVMDMSRYPDNC